MKNDEFVSRVQEFVSNHWPLISIIAGVILLVGAVMNWNWLCDPKGTRDAYNSFGRIVRRIAFGFGGAVLIAVGVWMLFI